MSSRTHAILAPSAAKRWLTCSKSARVEETIGDTTGNSIYADEGSFAHMLGEIYIKFRLKDKDADRQYAMLQETEEWDTYWSKELDDHCQDYADFVITKFHEVKAKDKHAKLIIEQRVELGEFIPESWGHVDAGIISDWKAVTIDLKMGKGVHVSVVDNEQQMIYGLGLINSWVDFYSPKELEMNIYQPRIDNIDEHTVDIDTLWEWAEKELKPKALLAFEGGDNFVPGTHCKFCKFRTRCKAYSEYSLELVKEDFMDTDELTEEEIASFIERLPVIKNWIGMVEKHALSEAVLHGKKWPGLKLVEGRSNRCFTDEGKVEAALLKAKVKPDIIYQPRQIFGITALEKSLGRATVAKLLNKFIVKPPGKPALVSVNDKRTEINTISQAIKDFADISDDDDEY